MTQALIMKLKQISHMLQIYLLPILIIPQIEKK